MRSYKFRGLVVGVLASALALTGVSAPAAAASTAPAAATQASAIVAGQVPVAATASVVAPSAVQAKVAVPNSGNKLVVIQDVHGNISLPNGSVLSASQVVRAEFNSLFPAGDLEIFQLHNDGTLSQVDIEIANAGQGGATASAAMHWFTGTWENPQTAIPARTTFYGGRPFAGSNKFERTFTPGTYIVTQLRPSGNVTPSTVAKYFTVIGSPTAQLPVVDGSITVVNTNGPDVFSVYSSAGSNKLKRGWVKLRNATGGITNRTRELHFIDFKPMTTGASTTREQACAQLAATGPGMTYSFGTMSTQQLVNGYLDAPTGWYWVSDLIPDVNTGTPHGFEDTDATAPGIQCDGKLVEVVAATAKAKSDKKAKYALAG